MSNNSVISSLIIYFVFEPAELGTETVFDHDGRIYRFLTRGVTLNKQIFLKLIFYRLSVKSLTFELLLANLFLKQIAI